ncbi:MAG TPA: metallophosphoesterase family protein, partial [Candidatus Hydrogenedentes bacterium]|nr:metallophosphoesterase family protein [Candidatus Hydrogenedentota bacterium]
MFKKKRIAMLIILAAAVYVGIAYSVWFAMGGLALLVIMLGGLSLLQYARAHRGFDRLAALRAKYGLARLVSDARSRLGDAETFSFVVLGDTRNRKRITAQVYKGAAAEQPLMVFHTGDIVRHGTAREFIENHVALLETIVDPIPMFCVPGNHERGARRDFAAFRALYGDDKFAFDLGPCRFVGFNNSRGRRVTEADLAFLETELAKPGARHRFVFFHIPPAFFETTFARDARRRGFKENANRLHALFVRHGVTEAFMAHIHGYATTVIDGVRYTLTAG